MNSLYGYVISESLPYEGLEFIEVTDETIKEALTTSVDSEYGYYLDVDIECRKKKTSRKIKRISNGSRKNENNRRYATSRTNRN